MAAPRAVRKLSRSFKSLRICHAADGLLDSIRGRVLSRGNIGTCGSRDYTILSADEMGVLEYCANFCVRWVDFYCRISGCDFLSVECIFMLN